VVDLSWIGFLLVGLLLALYELALWRLARPTSKEGMSEAAA
jgi:hypothetical protein